MEVWRRTATKGNAGRQQSYHQAHVAGTRSSFFQLKIKHATHFRQTVRNLKQICLCNKVCASGPSQGQKFRRFITMDPAPSKGWLCPWIEVGVLVSVSPFKWLDVSPLHKASEFPPVEEVFRGISKSVLSVVKAIHASCRVQWIEKHTSKSVLSVVKTPHASLRRVSSCLRELFSSTSFSTRPLKSSHSACGKQMMPS